MLVKQAAPDASSQRDSNSQDLGGGQRIGGCVDP